MNPQSATKEIEGKWWIRGRKKFRIFGRLNYSDSSITLEVEGNLFGRKAVSDAYITIFGESSDGRSITLLSCFPANSIQKKRRSFSKRKFSAQTIFIGAHITSAQDSKFRVAVLGFENFEDNLTSPMLFGPLRLETRDVKSVDATWRRPKVFSFHVPAGKFTFQSEHVCYCESEKFKVTLQQRSLLYIISDEVCSLDWFLNAVTKLRNVLTLVNGYPSFLSTLYLKSDGEGLSEVVCLQRFKMTDRAALGMPLIRIWELQTSELKQVLNSFYALSEAEEAAVTLFCSILSKPAFSPSAEFVGLMQAIEAFDRASSNDHVYMNQESYELEVAQPMRQAIPHHIPRNFRNKLEAMLRYGNEFSLRARLKRICDSLPDEVNRQLFASVSKFCGRATDTRNYFTHYDDEGSSDRIPQSNLLFANNGLQTFHLCVLLSKWGIPSGTLVNGLKNYFEYRVFLANRCW